jgi:hypothetical protein
MVRIGTWVFFLLPAGLFAQNPDLGLALGKVPAALYAQLPNLPPNQGILVEALTHQAPAWRGGLRPFDVIVALGAKPVTDAKSFGEQLRHLKQAQAVELQIFRAGREMVLTFDTSRKENTPESTYLIPKGSLKPGGPPSVTMQLQPLESGRLRLVLTFYSDNSGKMERLPYSGQLGEIERQIQKDSLERRLPERVQDLVEVALKRVRAINQSQK